MTAGPGALALVTLSAAFVVPYAATVLWIYRDARRRGDSRATAWAGLAFVVAPAFPVALVAYLLFRRDGDAPPPARIDRFLRNVAVAVVLGAVTTSRLTSPDPLAQASAVAISLPAVVLLALVFTYRDVLIGAVQGR